jgi:hypothetical protein
MNRAAPVAVLHPLTPAPPPATRAGSLRIHGRRAIEARTPSCVMPPTKPRAGGTDATNGMESLTREFGEGARESTRAFDPLTRLGAADENAAPIHPLPQRGEG